MMVLKMFATDVPSEPKPLCSIRKGLVFFSFIFIFSTGISLLTLIATATRTPSLLMMSNAHYKGITLHEGDTGLVLYPLNLRTY